MEQYKKKQINTASIFGAMYEAGSQEYNVRWTDPYPHQLNGSFNTFREAASTSALAHLVGIQDPYSSN